MAKDSFDQEWYDYVEQINKNNENGNYFQTELKKWNFFFCNFFYFKHKILSTVPKYNKRY